MNGFERVHECVGSWTDAGQWQVVPDEPIVRCKDCRWACVPDDDGGYGIRMFACVWWADYSRSYNDLLVEEDDFCSHGEKKDGE